MNAVDTQAARKFLHSKKDTGSFSLWFDLLRIGEDIHLLSAQKSDSSKEGQDIKAADISFMDSTILKKDKESLVLTVVTKRSGDIAIEARVIHTK